MAAERVRLEVQPLSSGMKNFCRYNKLRPKLKIRGIAQALQLLASVGFVLALCRVVSMGYWKENFMAR